MMRLGGEGSALAHLVEPLVSLLISLALGVAGGASLGFALQARGSSGLRASVSPALAAR